MSKIIPFKAIRPTRDKAYLVSSKPSYTYKKNLLDAKLESNSYTFLHVINPEFRVDDKTEPNSIKRFEKVKEKFAAFCNDGIFIQDDQECFYLYRQITHNNTHIGLIAGASVDEYLEGKIKVHEHTLTQREETFKTYLDVCQFNAEPVLLTYKDNPEVDSILNKYLTTRSEYEFYTTQHIKHDLWLINQQKDIDALIQAFDQVDVSYIADGHHRTASSVLYAKSQREKTSNYNEKEKFNYFLAYFIPESKLNIAAYNRAVNSLNGLSVNEFLEKVKECFIVEEKEESYTPTQYHNFSMYLDKQWYSLTAKKELINEDDVVEHLDARILYKNIVSTVLGIHDPKTDDRMNFIEGTKGAEGLQDMVDSNKAKVAFGLYPVSIEQLKAVADTNNIMPPKSTWIEPKMRSGLTIYDLKKS